MQVPTVSALKLPTLSPPWIRELPRQGRDVYDVFMKCCIDRASSPLSGVTGSRAGSVSQHALLKGCFERRIISPAIISLSCQKYKNVIPLASLSNAILSVFNRQRRTRLLLTADTVLRRGCVTVLGDSNAVQIANTDKNETPSGHHN